MRTWWSWNPSVFAILRQRNRLHNLLLFVSIFCFAALVPMLLRLKLSKLAVLLEAKPPRAAPRRDRIQRIVRYVDMALRIGTPLIRPGCLTRGVTLYYFLHRAGLDVTLCFGMGKVKDEFVGHCWLILAGEPYLERKDPRLLFAEVYRLPHRTTIVNSIETTPSEQAPSG
ncbi:MAG TPA: lasso peptide biosynthesis B2 protein [Chthonomonadaceae bacterium]|nr:lasso peptide biosynthesis B2 protein [Chthonomonadaceae bacterium]